MELISLEDMKKCLEDIGCHQDQIRNFMQYIENKETQKMYQFLRKQRCYLLQNLHQEQKRIDYIDYLIYILKKEDHQT